MYTLGDAKADDFAEYAYIREEDLKDEMNNSDREYSFIVDTVEQPGVDKDISEGYSIIPDFPNPGKTLKGADHILNEDCSGMTEYFNDFQARNGQDTGEPINTHDLGNILFNQQRQTELDVTNVKDQQQNPLISYYSLSDFNYKVRGKKTSNGQSEVTEYENPLGLNHAPAGQSEVTEYENPLGLNHAPAGQSDIEYENPTGFPLPEDDASGVLQAPVTDYYSTEESDYQLQNNENKQQNQSNITEYDEPQGNQGEDDDDIYEDVAENGYAEIQL